MAKGRRRQNRKGYGESIRNLKLTNIILVIIVAALVVYIFYPSVKGALIGQPPGTRLTGINSQLSGSQLSVINSAPNSYFQNAGAMLLNETIPGEQLVNGTYFDTNFQAELSLPPQHEAFTYDGKPSVIYVGAISCLWCGENRWAMALALSRFGSFQNLYIGYSALHDSDIPTLYWKPQDIYSTGSADFGNSYSSNYINFFSAEYDSNITQGFEFPTSTDPISFFVASAPNESYLQAMELMNSSGLFSGTPFTFWGTSFNRGANGVVFGVPSNSSVAASSSPPITYMYHSQILGQLGAFNTSFAYEEYAVADIYVAQICPSIGNAAPVCSLPAIVSYEKKMGLS